MKRFPWLLTLFTVPALAFLIGLGVWQVQRMSWKEGLIGQAEASAKAPPVSLEDAIRALEPHPAQPLSPGAPAPPPPPGEPMRPGEQHLPVFPEFQRVIVSCDWDLQGTVDLQTIQDGQPGVRIITLCGGFLVDLGFLPDGSAWRPDQKDYAVRPMPSPKPLLTQARTAPGAGFFTPAPDHNGPEIRFYARDNAAMAKALGVPGRVGRQVLFAEESAFPDVPQLNASPPPPAFANNHLGYAMTWFGLAITLVGFYVAMLWRRMRPKAVKDIP